MSIRFAREEDLPAILAIYAPYVENTAISFEYTVPTLPDFTLRFQNITRQFPWLVWEEDDKILGYAYGSAPFERAAFGWCAEASVYLHPDAHRRGIGRALYSVLEELMKLQGYTKVYALVTTDNAPSVAFHLACGYRHLALFPDCGFKFGKWYGLYWLEKPLLPVTLPDKPPESIREVMKLYQNFTNILAKFPLS